MLKFMRVKGNGENFKDGELVIYNDDNQEIIPINLFVHKGAEPNIELEPYKKIKLTKPDKNMKYLVYFFSIFIICITILGIVYLMTI